MKTTSLYIHYPFCLSKCHYCDFVSYPCLNKKIEDLTDFYLSELDSFYSYTNNRSISSIYFGGGTPSLMDTHLLDSILNKAHKLWHIDNNIEITMEANPKTVDHQNLQTFKSLGINRISLGVQSLDDKVLKFLGRIHSANDAIKTLSEIKNIFDNISADFIYALPNQTLNDWKFQLQKIKDLGLSHLSLYELIIEENTKIFDWIQNGKIKPVDENIAVDMYNFTNDFLKDILPQYEVSSYAKPLFQSKHNINYWEGGDYIGIGPASASRLKLDNKFIINENPSNINNWKTLSKQRTSFTTTLTKTQRAEELIIMGLRQIKGIDFKTFEENLGDSFFNFVDMNKIQAFEDRGLLLLSPYKIKVSKEGMLLLDTIILEIIK